MAFYILLVLGLILSVLTTFDERIEDYFEEKFDLSPSAFESGVVSILAFLIGVTTIFLAKGLGLLVAAIALTAYCTYQLALKIKRIL